MDSARKQLDVDEKALAPIEGAHASPRIMGAGAASPHAVPHATPRPGPAEPAPAPFSLAGFAGRFAEISADPSGAPLTLAMRLVLEAQRKKEPVAWIGRHASPFYPPDAADAGIDLRALPVIWVPTPLLAARAADLLVRSGGFGLVVVDLGVDARLPIPAQTRLAGLAREHDTALVFLTEKHETHPSIGSLVSLRTHAVRTGHEASAYRCEVRALKDKRRGPGWRYAEVFRGPDGLH